MTLETHLNELALPEAAALYTVVERLRAVPEREPSPELAERILAAVNAERAREHRRFRVPAPGWGAAAAAALVITLSLFSLFLPRGNRGPQAGSADAGLVWLAANQEADGSWNPARHGGAVEYRSALTALSALALASVSDRYTEGVRKACDALTALQTADGAFGGNGRAQYYNQAITTYALAALCPQRPELKPVLERSVGFIRARQTVEGGWDYEADSEGNAAITAWQVRALACAADRGVAGTDIPLRKGLRWLRGSTRDDGSVAYHRSSGSRSESLTALAAYALITAGKPFPELPALGKHAADSLKNATATPAVADCYRDYTKILALESAGSRTQADAVRGQMLKRQQTGAQDQWGTVGGKLYTTALTALVAQR